MKEKYTNPIVGTDVIVKKGKKILLVKRKVEPFKDKWKLPGGFVNYGERVEDAAIREVKEETGIQIKLEEILGVYSEPKRDPRTHVVCTVFISKVIGGNLKCGDDASQAKWITVEKIDFDELAFDCAKMINDYIGWKKKRQTFWSTK